ncbi:hypothetical protein SAMN04487944_11513 [Gracilibacillus ureilyticus]|uniref:Zinc dependent phospholipase C n=1 Tax=Gracilibacillus ureilyticus TaxID=531814 RepID=A0A1H9TVX4_9BACI|nr:zinc dependent phospholipase C family protein [Gracilibacillus ureilyticus]SES01249.1 hypothetical protein SAMN04487944_11513 [Gracilibacillus ureilyticus]
MGSRIMHLIVGMRVADSLAIEKKAPFLLGNIAPDAVFSPEDKTASHFYAGEIKDFTRYIDHEGFLKKYRTEAINKNQYVLGYYSHLITDNIWLKGFNLPWLRNRMEADEALYQLYHQDFRLLNGKLLEYYLFTDELRKTLSDSPEIIDLDEVKSADVVQFLPYVLGDMEYDPKNLDEELKVFTFNQIVGYIETAVEVTLWKMEELLSGKVTGCKHVTFEQ